MQFTVVKAPSDKQLFHFARAEKVWKRRADLRSVALVSVGGGWRDILVPARNVDVSGLIQAGAREGALHV